MTSGYDITIKLYQNYVIERVTCAVDAINVLMYLVVVILLFELISAVSQT